MSAQEYTAERAEHERLELREAPRDRLTGAKKPFDRIPAPKDGWSWLVDVEGDRAIITSGWGQVGLDIYKLAPGEAPTYAQLARSRGRWAAAISRQNDDLFPRSAAGASRRSA